MDDSIDDRRYWTKTPIKGPSPQKALKARLRASVSLPAMASVYVAYGVLRQAEKERADAG